MKTFSRYALFCLLLITSTFWFSGCSEDITIVNPGPPIPVLYGVFDLNESVHYLKLSKTFAGKADPYTLAQNHDEVFYTNAEVFLTAGGGSGHMTFSLENGIPRDSGAFPEYPNEAWSLKQKLEPGDYTLTVILPAEKDTLKADFTFINPFKVITPKAGFKRFYLYDDPILFSWAIDPSAGLYEITIILRYEEWLKDGSSALYSASYTRQLSIGELETDNGRYNYRFYSDSYFAYLGTHISKSTAVDYRKPTSVELIITAADTTLARYLNWFHLEIDDKVNPNGNVHGAIGVVGTKFSIPFTGLTLSPKAQDSLVKGRYTKKLNFVNNPDW